MKKILALIMVLAMAPLANAVIVGFNAPASAEPGDTITITMYSDVSVIGVALALLTDGGYGGTATAPGTWDSLFTTSDGGYNGVDIGYGAGDISLAMGAVNLPYYATGDLFSYTYAIQSGATPGTTITFTVKDLPEYYWTSYISYKPTGDPVDYLMKDMAFSVDVVPEPMTVALLGLGGLFLLRRRK